MCELCRRYVCPPRCPNAAYEPLVFSECEECGAEIYDGDAYYAIGELKFCESCVSGGYKIAEVDL